jgi:tetratricopeptide (TPR) repeat protein
MEQGDFAVAQTRLEDAAALCCLLGDAVTEALLVSNLSIVLARSGDLPGAMASAVKALELKQEIGDPISIGVAYGNLGDLLMIQGELGPAKTNLEMAIEQCADLKQAAGAFRGSLGWLCAQLGEHEQAEQHFRQGATALDGVYLAEYAQLFCKWGLAALLGDKKGAQLHLTAARAHYVQLGAHPNSDLAVLLSQLESAVSDVSL